MWTDEDAFYIFLWYHKATAKLYYIGIIIEITELLSKRIMNSGYSVPQAFSFLTTFYLPRSFQCPLKTTSNISLSQGTASDLSEPIGPNLNDFDLTAIYDRFVRPYKEKRVELDPTYFPYINKLPGKVKIIPDKSLRKLTKNHKKWGEKYPPEKYPLDAKTIEHNMLNLLKPGQIPGFNPAEFGLDDEKKSYSTSCSTSTHNNSRSSTKSSTNSNLEL
ncbi:7158_t:CDS:2, partial [Dentiscutata heterogama]